MALCLISPSTLISISKTSATYRPFTVTLEVVSLRYSAPRNGTSDSGLASGAMLTFDFFARQLLQAAVVRLRFKTGPSDMAAKAGICGRHAGSARLVKLGTPEGDGGGSRTYT